jgi:hypothetical protein
MAPLHRDEGRHGNHAEGMTMDTPASGLTRAAAGVALLFLATTVLAGVWGGIQLRALRASRAEQASLEQQLAALQPAQTSHSPFHIPSITPPPAISPTPGAPPPYAPVADLAPPPPDDDPMARLSGDPVLDAELMQLAAEKLPHSAPFFEQQNISPEKRAEVEKLLQHFYAKQMLIGRRAEDDNAMTAGFNELHEWYEPRLKAILTSREFAAWEASNEAPYRDIRAQGLHLWMDMLARHLSPQTRGQIIRVMLEEQDKAMRRIAADEKRRGVTEDVHVRSIAVHNEYLRCARERLAASLSPEDLEGFDLVATQMREGMNYFGDLVAETIDKEKDPQPDG